ncbi:urocortin-3 [Zootoca vivipara]|uniref:urocortin-3 n=1 Tax=Zootoca vivipara TaxID=8524 RepID=UPI001591306A|nr:urocortin-3 [Zootoca vivipara]
MTRPRLLILFLILFAARTSLSLKLYKAESIFGCVNAALSEARKGLPDENSVLGKRSFKYPRGTEEDLSLEDDGEEAEEDKRTFPAVTRYRYLAQAQGKGKVYRGPAKGDRRSKVTLSLDVPTNIMNILFSIAKAKNMRAKAEANAQLMAQIGRRK